MIPRFSLTVLLLAACGEVPTESDPAVTARPPCPAETGAIDPSGVTAFEVVRPAEYATQATVPLYPTFEDGAATQADALDFALGAPYPQRITVHPADFAWVVAGCWPANGKPRWTQLISVEGGAAAVSLQDGALEVELIGDGETVATLEGEITGVGCPAGHGEGTIALRHVLTFAVHRVWGFVVSQSGQNWPGCAERLALPSDTWQSAPTALPRTRCNGPFVALNAPAPVAIRLRSAGGLFAEGANFSGRPGHVAVVLDTDLPVLGLTGLELVGPEALTEVEASFQFRQEVLKGDVSQSIEPGQTYRRLYPDKENSIDLQLTQTMTTAGLLCASVPGAWLAASTSTPAICAAHPGSTQVGSVLADGECQLEVAVPGSPFRWATHFTTR